MLWRKVHERETSDEILEETRQVKAMLAESMNFDIDRILAAARQKQELCWKKGSCSADPASDADGAGSVARVSPLADVRQNRILSGNRTQDWWVSRTRPTLRLRSTSPVDERVLLCHVLEPLRSRARR